jgi:hypothetical protein
MAVVLCVAMATWVQVMDLVQVMDETRRAEGRIGEADADRLVTMLLQFQRQLVGSRPPISERIPRRSA